MMSRAVATVRSVDNAKLADCGVQIVTTDDGEAVNYHELSGPVSPGDQVLLNNTARDLDLGTGGYDFVIARLSPQQTTAHADRREGHSLRLRYTPLQHSVALREEDPDFESISDRRITGFPVVACELHSQIAPVAAAIAMIEESCAYIMTDTASLAFGFSNLAAKLLSSGLIREAFAVGQAFAAGPVANAVTIHDALISATHQSKMSAAIVCQGPGNTGSNTKYGFSGIGQASDLGTIAALGGVAIACVRASSADNRERHRGISHHTKTVLELARDRCIVAMPEGVEPPAEWLERHDIRVVPRETTQLVLDHLVRLGVQVSTMGRTMDEDPLYFHAAAAAGVVASQILKGRRV